MKLMPDLPRVASIVGSLAIACLALPVEAETVYYDDFTTPGSDKGGPYTSSLDGTATTTGGGTWLAGVEAGGWGQTGDGRATPTSSNFLAFTPDPGRIYTVQATIDTTPLAGADPGGTNSWFALGFTSSQHNWDGVLDTATINTGNLVRWNSNQVVTVTYSLDGATLSAAGVGFVGWITDRAGLVNLNNSEQIKITNFSLISGVANPTVTYDGNGSDGGTVPTDGSSPYAHSDTVTVLGAGTMTRTGFTFTGWNTAADGSGTDYSESATFTIYDNTTLYAQWLSNSAVTLTYDGNTNTGGSAPVDPSSPYISGDTVTVLGAGTLTKASHTFAGWNTAADGSGTGYVESDTFSINANITLYAQWTAGPDYLWDNGDLTDGWNTTDVNWSGVVWNNAGTSNAVFHAVGSNVFLDPGIAADAVNVGNASSNFTGFSLFDGSLAASTLTVQGSGTNAGVYSANPTLSIDSDVTIAADAAIGRANLNIAGGTFTADRIISAPASADWGRLVVSGGIVTTTSGVDGSVNTGATFAVHLTGGELRTPSVHVANRDLGPAGPDENNDAQLLLNGGTLTATGANNPDFITVYGDGGNGGNPSGAIYVGFSGAWIDTNGLDIGIQRNLIDAGGGGLTKLGAGTLTLSGANTYTGDTTVEDGVLEVSASGSLRFVPTSNTATNRVTGTASLSFLGTVNLDLGAADLTNGNAWTLFDVGTLGSATVTPAAITSTAGSFGQSGTTWTLVDGNNTWSFEETTGVLSLAVAASNDYETWGSTYGLAVGSEGGDLDNDGVTNFEEYAFGLIPNSGSSVNPIAVPFDKSTGTFSYTRRDPNLQNPALTYTVWYSTDLSGWTQDTGAVEGTPVLNGEVETVPVTISGSLLTNPALFIQVRAATP